MKEFTINKKRFLENLFFKCIRAKFLRIIIFGIFLFSTNTFAQTQTVRDFFSLPAPARCTSNDLDIISADLDLPTCVCTDGQTITAGLTLGIRNNTESKRASFSFWAQLTVTNPGDNSKEFYMLEGCENEILPGNDYIDPPRIKLATFSNLLVYKYNSTSGKYELVTDSNNVPIPEIPYICGTSLELTNIYQGWTDASKNDNRQCGGIDASKINPKCGIIPVLGVGVGLSAGSESTDISCNGAGDGSMKITFSGGKAPYYLDSGDGNGYSSTPIDLTTLPPGPPYEITLSNLQGSNLGTTYNWKIKDSSDPICEKGDSETFTDPAALSLTLKSTDISCNGAGDGIIALDDTATNSSFDSYKLYKVGENGGDDTEVGSVSPDATTGVFKSDMGAGSYYIIGTVASGNGVDTCTKKSDTETFTDPAALSLTLKSTDISCNGAGDGIIALDDTATNSSFDSYKLYKVGENGGDDTEVGSVSPDATTGVFKS
ncbi:SprB repeat-containing protein, partial [Christiangramia sabulilitoris]